MRPSAWRLPGSIDQPTACPGVRPRTRRAPLRRSAGAISPSGAAAPNHTVSIPCERTISAARRVAPGVGSIIVVGRRCTSNGCAASNVRHASTASGERAQVDASTTSSSGGRGVARAGR